MAQFNNKKVLITGGAAGIGKIMGQLALERQAELVIWDINPAGLDDAIAELSPLGKVSGYIVDLSDLENIKKTAEQTKRDVGFIDVLINNAGIVSGKYFHNHSDREISQTMAVNALAPMFVTKEFLNEMIDAKTGHICNIASLAGMISNPKMSAYAASKWSVIGWSDSLRIEMKKLKTNVRVTTICPYYINTGMFAGVKSLIPIMDPVHVARKVIKAIEKGTTIKSIPSMYHLLRISQGILPVKAFDYLVGEKIGIYKTMNDFTGREKNNKKMAL